MDTLEVLVSMDVVLLNLRRIEFAARDEYAVSWLQARLPSQDSLLTEEHWPMRTFASSRYRNR